MRIDKDLILAAHKVLNAEIARNKQMYVDYNHGGKKHARLVEECDGDFEAISLNLFLLKNKIDELNENYNHIIDQLTQEMQHKRFKRALNNKAIRWLTAKEKLEQRREIIAFMCDCEKSIQAEEVQWPDEHVFAA